MTRETIEVSGTVPARPKRVFKAWLSSKEHTLFTGQDAVVEAREGTRHEAGDGYIHGWTLSVSRKKRRFTQAWRTTEFAPTDPDSLLTVTISASEGGSTVEILHTDLPAGQGARYAQGWKDYYLEPLQAYFAARAAAPKRPPAKASERRAQKPAARRSKVRGSKKSAAAKGTPSAPRAKASKTSRTHAKKAASS